MIDDIYVFDDIIEKPYQELIKETLLGGDKPPTVDDVEEEFPWYYTSDITDATHEGPFQGRFGFSHQYVDAEEGIIENIKELHPLRVTPVSSDCNAMFALEVNRGWFEKNNVRIGDKVLDI